MLTLEQKLERAKHLRRMAVWSAEGLDDSKAAQVPTLYPAWKPDEQVQVGDRRYYEPSNKVYTCVQAHTTQADWTPDNSASLWSVIDVEHAGTYDDPIPAASNMEYFKDKYYIEDGTIYICTRDTGIPIAQMPSELVGVYFDVAGL